MGKLDKQVKQKGWAEELEGGGKEEERREGRGREERAEERLKGVSKLSG